MKPLTFENLKTIVCFGAHADDIEIGCGGTLLQLIQRNPGLSLHWHLFSGTPDRINEAEQSAKQYFEGLDPENVHFQAHSFHDAHFPSQLSEIKAAFHAISQSVNPDIVFTHHINDRHQDHRVLGEVAWQTFRNHCILEYEIPKYEGDLLHPNLFVPLEKSVCDRKVELLSSSFPSQASKQWYDDETFRSLLRIRGLECHSETRYAEAFSVRKMTLA